MLIKNHNTNLIQNALYSIEISSDSGFCFGVINAIDKAETILNNNETLYCVGDIVHNEQEIKRLESMGMNIIPIDDSLKLSNQTILFRAHGEPKASYNKVKIGKNNLIDATCPIVLALQDKIAKAYSSSIKNNSQIIIFGKKTHPEVIALLDKTENNGIVIEQINDIDFIDFLKPIEIFSQTTKAPKEYQEICEKIKFKSKNTLKIHDTICKQVSSRGEKLQEFSKTKEVVYFVGGAKSSNSKVLFSLCKQVNSNTYFIESERDIDSKILYNKTKIGICGATSTPQWLMQKVMQFVDSEMKQIMSGIT
ncbi:MAG: 4-hydroxy-3-methylbut-2-enyl diphosphate reductase [Salinivirgaceae bacterium]|nr:4-hydroxy-3-methylbut-2-enyl diphosphate reductase [Salinivirgaceae bacterium]